MHIVDIGPVSNNPQTYYKLIFGRNVSIDQILNSLEQTAILREQCGLTTKQNTADIVREAQEKLSSLKQMY